MQWGETRSKGPTDGLDVDVYLGFYLRYPLVSFISIMASLLLADYCHLDAMRTRAHTHASTDTLMHTQPFIRCVVIGLRCFEIENMIS